MVDTSEKDGAAKAPSASSPQGGVPLAAESVLDTKPEPRVAEEMGDGSPDQSPLSPTLQLVNNCAIDVLRNLSAVTPDQSKPGTEIYHKAKEANPLLAVAENTFIQYLSKLAHNPQSIISCEGRKQGYFLAEEAEKLVMEAKRQEPEYKESKEAKKRVEREKLLYPLLMQWARTRGYNAGDTSTTKAMGKWGNPDVAGVKVTEYLGAFSIELLTIEAKTSFNDWEQLIFESVSHRRFANRAYFAFAHPKDLVGKSVGEEMLYYAELFGVGLLVIGVENKTYEKLIQGELVDTLEPEEVDIREFYSSPYHYVPLAQQKLFCSKALKCDDVTALVRWGVAPEDDI
jgi:hypothetical protein